MDNLTYLMRAYFHEDWHHHQDSWQGVVDTFLTDDPAMVRVVPDEIDVLLTASPTQDELNHRMAALGCSYDPPEGYRDWLEAVRDRIRDASREAG